MGTMPDLVKKYFKDLKNGCNNLIDCQNLYKKIEAKEDLFLLDIRKKEDLMRKWLLALPFSIKLTGKIIGNENNDQDC